MRLPGGAWLLAMTLSWAVHPAAWAGQAETDGKRLYREGILPSGRPLVAALPGGAQLTGRQAACVTCHRKSGLGSSEGTVVIRPMTVPGFFADQENPRHYARRPNLQLREMRYTEAGFGRALRDGVAADGRLLNPLMPKYSLDAEAVSALRAYLSSLALEASPGVTDSQIHFATIMAPDAEPQVREATLQVLAGMAQMRNAGSRSEKRRQNIGFDRSAVNWREWVLHVWELSGAPETWAAQLERLYREQPVFAVLSGAGRNWQPVHDFCERQELPCLFPNVDVPGRPEPGAYNLYLSGGVQLEAEVMARHLADQGWSGPVWQIRRPEYRAEAGARAFAQAWQGKAAVRDIVLHGDGRDKEALDVLAMDRSGVVILWLEGDDLAGLSALIESRTGPVMASGTLLGEALTKRAYAQRLLIAWPYALPGAVTPQADRVRNWLRSRGIPYGDPRSQANAYLTTTLVGDAVMHLGNNYSREYLIERIEHGADKSLASGAFPRVELGPGQRYASKGAYLVRPGDAPERPPVVVADWLVP